MWCRRIGENVWGKETSPGVHEILETRLLSVRDASGDSYCVAWSNPGGSFAFMPNESKRMAIGLEHLAKIAVSTQRGLVINPNRGDRLAIPSGQLAAILGA